MGKKLEQDPRRVSPLWIRRSTRPISIEPTGELRIAIGVGLVAVFPEGALDDAGGQAAPDPTDRESAS